MRPRQQQWQPPRQQQGRGTPYGIGEPAGAVRTLDFLKSHNSEYLSGRDLGDVLGISRVAVWKHIRFLKGLGYDIESKQKVGYKLLAGCDEPYPWEISDGLAAATIGGKISYYDAVESTQDVASELEQCRANNGAVVVAAEQTGARGRAGRRWASPRGGIWMSVALYPRCGAQAASLLPLAAGVAVAGALRDECGVHAQLRWPNDVTIRGRKVAGIITEAELELNVMQKVCIGIGVNYDLDVRAVQEEFSRAPGFYGATSVRAEYEHAGAEGPGRGGKIALARGILLRLDRAYREVLSGETARITSEWSAMSSTVGARVSVRDGGVTGVATGIAENGMLIIRPDGADAGADYNGDDDSGPEIRIAAGSLEYL